MDVATLEFLRKVISRANLSVFMDTTSQMREYIAQAPGGQILTFSYDIVAGNVEYEISLDKDVLASISIPLSRQVFTVVEKEIMELFRLCSARVVLQETQIRFNSIAYPERPKIYS